MFKWMFLHVFIDQDGKLDHVIAVCEAQKCSIQVYDVSFI